MSYAANPNPLKNRRSESCHFDLTTNPVGPAYYKE